MTRFLGYLVYIVFLGTVTILLIRYGAILKEETGVTFNPYPFHTFLAIYPIIIGMLLGIPNFWSFLRTEGRIFFDWIKLGVVGLPALLVAIAPLALLTELSKHLMWIVTIDSNGHLSIIAGIVFGYTLLTCFNKTQSHFGTNLYYR